MSFEPTQAQIGVNCTLSYGEVGGTDHTLLAEIMKSDITID